VGLALGQLLVVVGPALAALVPDLADRGHMDRVVEAPVAAQRQPACLLAAGGHLHRRGAVAHGEVIRSGNRNTWRTSPATVPAITGPTPKMPVRLVPEAFTAAASF
jgi:hypothetical protein